MGWRARHSIKAGGEWHAPGSILPELSAEAIDELRATAAIEPAESTDAEDSGTGGAPDDADLLAAARELRQAYDAGEHDPAAWTQGGKPYTELLSEHVGRQVTAAERDRVWTAVPRGG